MINYDDKTYIYENNYDGVSYKLKVVVEKYHYGGTALILKYYDDEFCSWETFMIPSVFLEGYSEFLDNDLVYIKNYSENEGILEWLQSVCIVGPVLEVLRTDYVDFYLVKIL